MRLSRTVIATAVAALLATGCSQDPAQELGSGEPGTSASTSQPDEPEETSASPTPSPSNPSPSTLAGSEGFSVDDVVPDMSSTGGFLGSRGTVRVGHHPGFDRVVWQFRGRGRPRYGVYYVDEPLAEGSGDRVDVRGDAYLQVDVSRVGIPAGNGPRPTDAPDASLAGTVVADARAIDGGFEGGGQAWIGVHGGKRPFRVMVLKNPTRVVVDIQTD